MFLTEKRPKMSILHLQYFLNYKNFVVVVDVHVIDVLLFKPKQNNNQLPSSPFFGPFYTCPNIVLKKYYATHKLFALLDINWSTMNS